MAERLQFNSLLVPVRLQIQHMYMTRYSHYDFYSSQLAHLILGFLHCPLHCTAAAAPQQHAQLQAEAPTQMIMREWIRRKLN